MAIDGQRDFGTMVTAAENWRKQYASKIDDPENGVLAKNNQVTQSLLTILDYVTKLDGSEIHIGWDISEPNLPEIPTDYTIGIHYAVDSVDTTPGSGGTTGSVEKTPSGNEGDGTLSGWQSNDLKHWKEYSISKKKVQEGNHIWNM